MIVIVEGRLAFPNLFHAKQFEGQGASTYSASVLIDPESDAAKKVESALNEVAVAAWGAKTPLILKTIVGNNQKCCWYPGDLKSYDGFHGMMVLSAKRQEKDGHPKVVARNPSIDLQESDGKPYGGCYVRVKVDLWAQKNQYGNGIRATLIAVQFLADGDAFSPSGPASVEGFQDESANDEAPESGLI